MKLGLNDVFIKWKRLFAGTPQAFKNLFAGTPPFFKNLFAGTLLAKNNYFRYFNLLRSSSSSSTAIQNHRRGCRRVSNLCMGS